MTQLVKYTSLLWILLFISGFSACSCDDPDLYYYCSEPQPCYIGRGGVVIVVDPDDFENFNINNSNCSLGITECDRETRDLYCREYKPPYLVGTDEQCDGIDNDCNFQYDEFINRSYDEEANTCALNNGTCIQNQVCDKGVWRCELIWPDLCGEEVCNNLDDDGDGLVDSEDPDLFPNGPEFYWPEDIYPSDDLYFGLQSSCSPGRVRCIDGTIYHEGLGLPDVEQCGDGLDNDCDGTVDEVEDPDYQAAFALILDVSGSMNSPLEAATEAVCNFSQNAILGNSYFAVVFIGYSGNYNRNQIILGTDFVDSDSLCAYLAAEPWIASQGGREYQLEGIMATHQQFPMVDLSGNTPTDPNDVPYEYQLNWPEDLDKKVIVFSDEEVQTTPSFLTSMLIEQCQEESYTVGILTHPNFHYQWHPIVNECGGFTGTLYTNSYFMEQELIQNLTGGC